ncbi:hypothetical protein Tco_1352028 [Tanacetum coccineum]
MYNGSASTSNHRRKAKTSQPWTTAEEITLCKAWCNVTVNYVTRDAMKRGFWSEVVAYFEKGTGENIRGYDAIMTKWKNSIRPKIDAFSVVYDSVQRMDESGTIKKVNFNLTSLACLNTYLGKINTRVPISSYELSTLNSASNVVLEGNWISHSHYASLPAAANATNSDFIVEPVMHVCFLEAHEMTHPPSRNTHLLVEDESST